MLELYGGAKVPGNLPLRKFRVMTTEKLAHSQVKATFEVTAEEFDKALDKAFEVCNKKVTIKGFRAGKAPRSVYEKNYGVESLYDEALNTILNAKAQEIYADQELSKQICGKFEPNIESTEKIEKGKGLTLSLTFDVYPEVSLPQYKGLEVKKQKLTATPKEVLNALTEQYLKKDAKMVAKEEQVIAEGDYATFDFVGTVDGVEFPGGKADNYELQIGSKQFIPGFEDQMIGMKAEETKDLEVKFPKNYQEKSLAGKKAVFKVTVHEVKVEVLPELTDDFVKGLKIEGVETVAALKKSKKAELEEAKKVSEKDRQVDELINKILDNAVVDMPASLVEERVNGIKAQYENQAKMYNIPFDTFLGLMNISKEDFEKNAKEQGARQALFSVVANKIIEVENLAPTKEEIEAKTNGDKKANVMQIFNQLAYEKLINLILTKAVEI